MELALAGLLGLAVFGLLVVLRANYQDDIRVARTRVAAGVRMVKTPYGPIEYADPGDGPPILVVHGAGGGFDQGLDLTEGLRKNKFRLIAISRFGYLGTPLPRDASPMAQADAYACVLDALHVARCAVLGVSAGGPSALQFALRHPGRVSALVLMVPATGAGHLEQRKTGAMPKRMSVATRIAFDTALRSDFLFWLASRVAHSATLRAVLGTPPALVASASPSERARVEIVLNHILPVSARRLGLLNDAAVLTALARFEFERITAPTLLISTPDDLFQTFDGARYAAEHIPNARFVGYASGGHLLVGHNEATTAEIVSFLLSTATSPARASTRDSAIARTAPSV